MSERKHSALANVEILVHSQLCRNVSTCKYSATDQLTPSSMLFDSHRMLRIACCQVPTIVLAQQQSVIDMGVASSRKSQQ